jgi:hypothetical protein
MTSWANRNVVPLKTKEPTLRWYYEPVSDDYASSTLGFLYSYIYSQRNAEPFYIVDTPGYVQPLLQHNPIFHYLKQTPSSGQNLSLNLDQAAPTLNSLSLASLRRTALSVYQFNSQTSARIDAHLTNFGMLRQTFDAGIVLDLSGCVPAVITALKTIQKRTGKKSLNVFVMTDTMDLLKEFAVKGDPTWRYASILRMQEPTDKESRLLKTLSELKVLRTTEFVVLRLSSPLGKLIYLTNPKLLSDNQVVSIDGTSWKAL